MMTIHEKQKVAAIARSLIRELELCDDEAFLVLVLECVANGDPVPIQDSEDL